MKLIIAYIQPERLNAVKQVLFAREIYKMSVTNALGCGRAAGLLYGGGFGFLGVQALGAACTAARAFGTGCAIFFTLKKLGILRVSVKTEMKGLDLVEHGQDAYASFQFFSNT